MDDLLHRLRHDMVSRIHFPQRNIYFVFVFSEALKKLLYPDGKYFSVALRRDSLSVWPLKKLNKGIAGLNPFFCD